MKYVIRIYSALLLGYTGWRTYDFMHSQLPENYISFWLSVAFLFATEVGLVLWHETGLNHVTTIEQDYLCRAMTWVDFFGSLIAGIADMILRQTLVSGYAIPPAMVQFLIYGLPTIMAMNVAAVLIFETNDAKTQMSKAEKALVFEAHQQALKNLSDSKAAFAERMQNKIARDIEKRASVRVEGKSFVEKPETASSGNGNGNHHGKVEDIENLPRIYPADVPVNPTLRKRS